MKVTTNNNIKCTIALAALQQVKDPEIGLNVVDLGLIYELEFDEEGSINAQMTLTTQYCPMGASIVNGVTNALRTTFGSEEVKVELTFDPRWNAERISDEGKEFLNK
jgi:metal-sulfur cluster biosynthetic enzyme